MGDIVHTYPMVYDIKNHNVDCTIDWLVDEDFADIVRFHPLINNTITIPMRFWKKNKLKLIFNFKNWYLQLKQKHYDYIIDSQGLLKSSLLSKFFIGPVYGFSLFSIREKLACLQYDYKINVANDNLAINKNRLLAAKIFEYKIDINERINFGLDFIKYDLLGELNKSISNYENKNQVCNLKFDDSNNYVIFFHATSRADKKYPINLWVDLAIYLITQHDFKILLSFGNELEKSESLQIKHKTLDHLLNKDYKLVNGKQNKAIAENAVIVPEVRYEYPHLIRLINNSAFIFGVDTGLIHLANAMNKKLIAIYTSTNPAKTGIYSSAIAKNIGNKNLTPSVEQIILLFEKILIL